LWELITVPLIGALIGWVTNILAIKLIFRPYRPWVIPFLNYQIQGLIPKRRSELAFNVGQVVGNELLSIDDMMEKLNEAGVRRKIIKSVVEAISARIDEKIPLIVPLSIKKMIINLIQDVSYKETFIMLERLSKEWENKIGDEINIARIIEEKINSFDLTNLERVILIIASRELQHIEILGAFLGFLIGTVQALILYFLNN